MPRSAGRTPAGTGPREFRRASPFLRANRRARIRRREAERFLLARYAPPAVVLSEDLEILQFRGDTGPFLAPAPGKASQPAQDAARGTDGRRAQRAPAGAQGESVPARAKNLRVRSNGGWRDVDVEVIPLRTGVPHGAYVVVFEEAPAALIARARQMHDDAVAEAAQPGRSGSVVESNKEVIRLAQELTATREYLQSVIEQQEAANEELQSANEEVQSTNEELQSINEELETSKEEIQSSQRGARDRQRRAAEPQPRAVAEQQRPHQPVRERSDRRS